MGAQTSIAVTLTDDDVVAKTPPTMANMAAQVGKVGAAFSFNTATSCTATDGDPITGYAIASGTLPANVTLTTPSVPPVRLTVNASVPTFSAIVRVAAPANDSAPGVSGLIVICSVPAGTDAPSISLQLRVTFATTATVGMPEIKPVVGFNVTFAGSVPVTTA